MRTCLKRDDLLAALTPLTAMVSKQQPLVLVQAEHPPMAAPYCRLIATNETMSIEITIAATGAEEGAVTLPANTVIEMLAQMPPLSEVKLESVTASTTRITCEKTTSKITGSIAEDYTVVSTDQGETHTWRLHPQNLAQALAPAIATYSRQADRAALNGIKIVTGDHSWLITGCDGYMLGMATTTVNRTAGPTTNPELLVPAANMAILQKLLKIADEEMFAYVPTDVNCLILDIQGRKSTGIVKIRATSWLIDLRYPEVTHILPKSNDTLARVDPSALLDAINASTMFVDNGSSPLRFTIDDTGITIFGQGPETGDSTNHVDATVTGPPLEIKLAAGNIKRIIGAVPHDAKIALGFTTHTRPITATRNGKPEELPLYVLMPMTEK